MSHSTDRFSKRMNVRGTPPEISTYEAPPQVRVAVVAIALELGFTPTAMVNLACRVLRERAENNWSPGVIRDEAHRLLANCEWFKVYDVAEAVAGELRSDERPSPPEWIFSEEDASPPPPRPPSKADAFSDEFTEILIENGVGWKMHKGRIELRGSETNEAALRSAMRHLEESGRATAAREMREAMNAVSRRPYPDITGSAQHALAALECLMGDVCGDPKSTFGQLLHKHPGIIPKPLDKAAEMIWGFASNMARHVTEGQSIQREEAVLLVWLGAALVDYLAMKHPSSSRR